LALLSISYLCPTFSPCSSPTDHVMSLRYTKQAHALGFLYFLFSLYGIFFLQTSMGLPLSFYSELCSSVTSTERLFLITQFKWNSSSSLCSLFLLHFLFSAQHLTCYVCVYIYMHVYMYMYTYSYIVCMAFLSISK
jgi:hypothetical protein